MDQVKNNSPTRFREFDAKLERISGQSKCDDVAKAGFVGDGHVHFKGENLNLSKDAAPASMAQSGSGKTGGLPG